MRFYQRVIKGGLREIVFGLEDGLVSTLGVITGIASGTASRRVVILSGFILVIVEALSMAAGTYLSNKAEMEQNRSRRGGQRFNPLTGGLIMGVAYVAGGAVPLSPYLVVPLAQGLAYSVFFTIIVLFGIGFFKGRVTRTPAVRSGVEMAVVSLSAAIIGYLVGDIGSKILMIPR